MESGSAMLSKTISNARAGHKVHFDTADLFAASPWRRWGSAIIKTSPWDQKPRSPDFFNFRTRFDLQ
jgi:hypothetical protein